MNRLIFLFFILLIGCSRNDQSGSRTISKKVVKDHSLLLSADTSTNIGTPSLIKAVPGGFILYDFSLQKIIKFNNDGRQLLSFGREGQGPGEFQSLMNLWSLNDSYLLYDFNNAKLIRYDNDGQWIEDKTLKMVVLPSYPTQIEAINHHKFVVPTGGKNGSLMAFADNKNDSTEYFGNAVAEYVQNFNPVRMQKQISSGTIPASMQNVILLGSNESGIFSFQQTTSVLEKYSYSGALIWQKKIDVSVQNGLFDHTFQMNAQEDGLYPFYHAEDISVNNQGVALMLHVLDKEPITVVWIPNSGDEITVVTFEGIKNQPRSFTFAVAADQAFIFFVNARNGKIYKAHWPL